MLPDPIQWAGTGSCLSAPLSPIVIDRRIKRRPTPEADGACRRQRGVVMNWDAVGARAEMTAAIAVPVPCAVHRVAD